MQVDSLRIEAKIEPLILPSEQKLHRVLVIPGRTFYADCYEQSLLIKVKHSAGAVEDSLNQATSSSAETRALIEQSRTI